MNSVDMGDLETLSAVLPQLDEDIEEAEEILRQRNDALRDKAKERDFLQSVLDSLMMQQRAGATSTYNSLDPQQNYEALLKEIERIREKTTVVERDAEEKRMEELRIAKQRSTAENESSRLVVEIEQLERQIADRDATITELKTQVSTRPRALTAKT